MAATYITPDKNAVVSEIFVAAPRERVFTALIDRAQALQWGSSAEYELTEWQMELRPGGKWKFIARKRGDAANHDLVHYGEITDVDPPRLLQYTWFASWHSDPSQETLVRWELSAASGGTQVKVTHSGLGPMPEDCKGYAQGWPGLVTRIKQFVEANIQAAQS
jgi:uncharacterized protein YndB with AHSA1/START domain